MRAAVSALLETAPSAMLQHVIWLCADGLRSVLTYWS